MNNHDSREEAPPENAETTLYKVLREDGKLCPASIEDVERLEQSIDEEHIEAIDPARLLARVREPEEPAPRNIVSLQSDTPARVHDEMLAMAARNAGKLSEQARRQMDQDRKDAERRLGEQGDE